MRIVQKKFTGGNVYPSYYYDMLSNMGSSLAENEHSEINYDLNPLTEEDYYRRQEELASLPETALQTAARYVGYVVDPIGGIVDYVQNSDWAPNWLKRSAPYIGIAGLYYRGPKPKMPKGSTSTRSAAGGTSDPTAPKKSRLKTDSTGRPAKSRPESQKGQLKSTFGKSVNDFDLGYNPDGYKRGTQRRQAQHTRTSADDAETVSLTAELVRELWMKPKTQLPALTQPAAKETPLTAGERKRGRPNARDAQFKLDMHVLNGTGIVATSTKVQVAKALESYFRAVAKKYALLNAQLQGLRGPERVLVNDEIIQLRLLFNKELGNVRGYGHLFEVPNELRGLVY